jgi:nucleotide-binding universal stress UspA family protein
MTDYRILVAIDLQAGTEKLLDEVRRHAKAHNAVVDLIHVADPDPAFVGYIKAEREGMLVDSEREARAKALRAEHQKVESIGNDLRASGVRVDRALIVQGPIGDMVIQEAQKLGADLLVVGEHHHAALYRAWYGDIALNVARKAPCTVLIVPV